MYTSDVGYFQLVIRILYEYEPRAIYKRCLN